jgi:hypothetical protein
VEAISRTVREAAVDGDVSSQAMLQLFYVAIRACCRQVERESNGAGTVGVLIAARQACELGVRRTEDVIDTYDLAAYASAVQDVGDVAIDAEDANTLWQCLETLGWIGCSAVRADSSEIAHRAAGGLVQLGRLARHAQLECHWNRCALTPYQHAVERLQWLLSWIPRTENPDRWLDLFDQAFSRLIGRRYEFEYSGEKITHTVGEEAWVEGFSADGGSRRLDYSDHAMLKQQAL